MRRVIRVDDVLAEIADTVGAAIEELEAHLTELERGLAVAGALRGRGLFWACQE